MKVLIIGGDRHGEFVTGLPDGSQAWVDIRTATTFPIARWDWAVQEAGLDGLPEVVERYRLWLAIHPQIQAHPACMTIAQEAVMKLAVTKFMQTEGAPLPVPAPADKAPDTPAALFGPDGQLP